MIDRVVEIAETSSFLRVKNRLLCIEGENGREEKVPLSELGVLLLSKPSISLTLPVLSEVLGRGGMVVICDNHFLPVGLALPLAGHCEQTAIFANQANLSLPAKKRLWQQLVKAKISFQAELLGLLHGTDSGLAELAGRVRSGDPDNLEGQAAQRYWKKLFGDKSFLRKREAEDQNRLLNYGYMVLRAALARAGCAAGLHPSLGIHHHNIYDQFCLASDLMEPFRPLVDRAAAEIVSEQGPEAELTRDNKLKLIGILGAKVLLGGEKVIAGVAFSRLASSVAAVCCKGKADAVIPESLIAS